jgi:hypothetical protein
MVHKSKSPNVEINPKTGKKVYYKDNPVAVKLRDSKRMYVNGKEVSKKHPLHKPGRYKSFGDAAFSALQKDVQIKEGYVYVITNPAWPDWVKIGMAIDSDDRCNSYQTSSPHRDYELKYDIETSDRRALEQAAHKEASKLASESKGEWFKLDVETAIEILNNLKEQDEPRKRSA